MSTILKALHRLEEGRDSELERPLREQVSTPPPARRSAPAAVGLVMGTALVMGIGVGAAQLWLRPGAPTPAAAPAALPEVPAASLPEADGTVSRVSAVQPAEGAAEGEEGSPAASVREPAALPGPAPAPAPKPAASQEPAPAPREDPPAELPQGALRSPVAVVEPRAVPRDRDASVATVAPKPTLEEPAPVQRPPRRPAPSVFVARTLWHPTPGRRVAWIELGGRPVVEVHEGDEVGALRIERIDPSGVFFAYEGVEMHRRVGMPPH